MKRASPPSQDEAPEDRRARAVALQASILGKASLKPKATDLRPATGGELLVPGLSDVARKALEGLTLHARRYGLDPVSRTHLRKMGCRSLADVASAPYGKCVNWLGYAQADAVRERMRAIVGEADAGAAEPGIARMIPGLDKEAREWLVTRPVEDAVGRGISVKVIAALRSAGHVNLVALATEEVDEIEDIQGIGKRTVGALRNRIEDILAESEGSPSRGVRRTLGADDAEWDAASPPG